MRNANIKCHMHTKVSYLNGFKSQCNRGVVCTKKDDYQLVLSWIILKYLKMS